MDKLWAVIVLAYAVITICANFVSALSTPTTSNNKPLKVVVIGGGWAGFSAADSLSLVKDANGAPKFEIEVLDASPRGPGGLAAGWRTPKLNKPVEAGLHGFWREYQNTFATMERIGLDLDNVLTPFTPSVLVSDSGRVALAPVLGSDNNPKNSETAKLDPTSQITNKLAEVLPPPLDLAILADIDSKNPLTPVDRLSGIGALGVWADFGQEDPESWDRYDKISAENLFKAISGVTPALYNELVSPLLHVLPMTPGYDCSAAAALSCLHVFALQTRGAFDVRWCRGSITEQIFNPWSQQLQDRGNVQFQGNSKVTSIVEAQSGDGYTIALNGQEDTIDADCLVLAIGGTSLKRLLPACPPLTKLPQTKAWKNFRGVTCVAVRLFFESKPLALTEAMSDSPVVVCGAKIGDIPQLTETGFCLYDLERLQDSDEVASAVEVDFFRADALADKTDEEVIDITLRAIASALDLPTLDPETIADTSVVRARDAVSHFCVGSAGWSPDVKLEKGLYICGDWIDRKGHASWSTEKSVVTGIQVATELAKDFGAEPQTEVIPAASDTAQLKALRSVARTIRGGLPQTLNDSLRPQAPWTLARRFFS